MTWLNTGIQEQRKLFSRLFNLRLEGDYADLKRLDKEDIEPFFSDVREFFMEMESLLK